MTMILVGFFLSSVLAAGINLGFEIKYPYGLLVYTGIVGWGIIISEAINNL